MTTTEEPGDALVGQGLCPCRSGEDSAASDGPCDAGAETDVCGSANTVPVGQGLCPCRSTRDAGASGACDAQCAAYEAMPAARVRAEIGDAPLSGIEGRLAYCLAKRAFDVAFSLAVLVCLSWLFAIVAVAVKLDDPKGPVLFRQTRVTKGGREFTMYKFRSMCADAEERLSELKALNEKTGPVFKMRDDPRVTRVGRVLRGLSVDELPQLLNVFKGDMSLIGPRPGLPREAALYDGRAMGRLRVKPGCGGPWQVSGRSDLGFDEMVMLDLAYIENRSIKQDIRFVFKTIGAMLSGRGAM